MSPGRKAWIRYRLWRWGRRACLSVGFVCVCLWISERVCGLFFPFPVELMNVHSLSSEVFAEDGQTLRVAPSPAGERHIPVELERISPFVRMAIVSAEDERFFWHTGVDPLSVFRATLFSAMSGRVVSGASTLTMQLARTVEPGPRTFQRKIREMFRARQMEDIFTKDEILEAYLNHVPWGGTLRGVEAASRYWFGKESRDLSAPEAATLICMLPSPSYRRPDRRPMTVAFHRDKVLRRMWISGFLTEEEYEKAAESPMTAKAHEWPWLAPHASDWLMRGSHGAKLYTGIDLDMQTAIERAVASRTTVGVDGVAVVVMDRHNGIVRAMVGSTDYRAHPFNAALARRGAGSTLKPFIYALAWEDGLLNELDPIEDLPATFGWYEPRNFDETYKSLMAPEAALAQSRNLPAIRLLRDVGVDRFRDLLYASGIETPDAMIGLDAALGSIEVSAIELAEAYRRLFSADASYPIRPDVRRWVMDAMSRNAPRGESVRIAIKTGTSSGRRDAWSVGVTDGLVVVVWRGNLDGRPHANLVGAEAATPLLLASIRELGRHAD